MVVRRPAHERAEALRLRREGYSIPEIAAALGIARSTARQQTKLDAARELDGLNDRRALIALGALAYWCEGAKDKPYSRREKVRFANSDFNVIRALLAWLDLLGIREDRRRFELSIHETADVGAAGDWWAAALDVDPRNFYGTSIKRHNPRTNRLRVDESYRGVLVVHVLGGRELYQQIEGWASQLLSRSAAAGRPVGRSRPDSLRGPDRPGPSAVG